jgi:hypothetical protein
LADTLADTLADSTADSGGSAICGDGKCEYPGETPATCAKDCANIPYCGNGVCDGTETAATCAKDCGGDAGSDAADALSDTLSDTLSDSAVFDGSGGDGGPKDSGAFDTGPSDSGGADSSSSDAVGSCTGKADGTPCISAMACTVGATCSSGQCQGGKVSCDDGNSCTEDACDAMAKVCKHSNVVDGTTCSDGEPCTQNDSCSAGSCKAGTKICEPNACKDKTIECGGSLLLTVPDSTSVLTQLGCAAGSAPTGGKEWSVLMPTACSADNQVVLRAFGTGSFGSAPIDQQAVHVYLIDEDASALSCGNTVKCTDLTMKQQKCGTSGPAATGDCAAEWLISIKTAAKGARRIVIDTLASAQISSFQALAISCQCAGGSCGDGKCDSANEDKGNCPADCGSAGYCGDGKCDPATEDMTKCPADCMAICGDGKCMYPTETPQNCNADCGSVTYCGNGTCDAGETPATCSKDCK